jgi:uracil-DNA glycosylase family 4
MIPELDGLRQYVHFLHEREGVRKIRLTKTAQLGLARLAAAVRAAPERAAGGAQTESAGKRPIAKPASPAPTIARGTPATPKPEAGAVHNIVSWPTKGGAPVIGDLPIETAGSTKAEKLAHLAERASVCVKCPHLAARRHTVVFGVGDPEAKLMFVGEAPGEEEDLKGEPFVGRAGQLLTKMIAAMGLRREDVYIANIVKCRPDMPPGAPGNRKPTRQEMETCVPYLHAQIDAIKPVALVALGASAVEGLLGPVGTIGSLRGKFLEYRGTPLMPTYHPSYLLRSQGSNTEKRKVWEDLLKVMGRLEMPISEKQQGFFLKA